LYTPNPDKAGLRDPAYRGGMDTDLARVTQLASGGHSISAQAVPTTNTLLLSRPPLLGIKASKAPTQKLRSFLLITAVVVSAANKGRGLGKEST
jgi:hypothetical protein